jgi:hypothetical protein
MKALLTLLFVPALVASAQNAAPGTRNAMEQTTAPTPGLDDSSLAADSPKTFPRKGSLPLLYPPNLPMRDEEAEADYFIFSAPLEAGTPIGHVPTDVPAPSRYPGRTLEQIARIESEMPKGTFTAPRNDWQHLTRTHRHTLLDGHTGDRGPHGSFRARRGDVPLGAPCGIAAGTGNESG